jgi:hypothetical protein
MEQDRYNVEMQQAFSATHQVAPYTPAALAGHDA